MAIEAGEQDGLVALTTQIVAAYAAGNHLAATELPGLIRGIHASLQGLAAGKTEPAEKQRVLTPAEIRRSIQPDALFSFEDGKAYKTLRRHLAHHGLTPEAYRAKWGLPVDYPMTASAYSAERSQLARDLGLGKSRLAAPVPASSGSDDPVENADDQRADDATSASQLTAEVPEHVDVADEFDEGITREPFDEDGVEP
jgi:predicted transcriptional regulator